MTDFLSKAGPLIYPLAACSLLACTITLERLWALRRRRVLPREIVEVVEAVRPDRDLILAIEVCRRNPGVFSNIMRQGLELTGEPWEVIRDAVSDVGRRETTVLQRHLVWLQTVAQAAPLLGLLGTVTGMIKLFGAISVAGLGDPQALSEGISEAILTTAAGLVIGIPTLVAYNLLSAKAESLVTEIETHASMLLQRLRHGHPVRVTQ
ncbi:MAG: MotA/TolQ/ExbB proton channel family protein [Candidatus Eisenbacteria bacterium]|jgi:biopolymer transport protein ExbB|nr:MotA/TolQ/ExbB proton channel family protein [Candidatus Eisenbacteria bacterium]